MATSFKKIMYGVIAYIGLMFCITLHAQTHSDEARFEHLTQTLRCLVCQNESLWDSHADLAKDLRADIQIQIRKGASNEEIKHYLVQRYGEFILLKPAFHTSTYALWILPFVFLLLGFYIVIRFKGKRS